MSARSGNILPGTSRPLPWCRLGRRSRPKPCSCSSSRHHLPAVCCVLTSAVAQRVVPRAPGRSRSITCLLALVQRQRGIVPIVEVDAIASGNDASKAVRRFVHRLLVDRLAADVLQQRSTVQRFGSHRRAGRAVGPVTGQAAVLAATHAAQEPTNAQPRYEWAPRCQPAAHWPEPSSANLTGSCRPRRPRADTANHRSPGVVRGEKTRRPFPPPAAIRSSPVIACASASANVAIE